MLIAASLARVMRMGVLEFLDGVRYHDLEGSCAYCYRQPETTSRCS